MEARVLLSATSIDTDVYDTSSDDYYADYDMDTYEYTTDAPDDPYGDTDYFDLAANSPLADQVSEYEDEFYEYESYSTGQADGAYEDATYELPDSQTGDNAPAVNDTPATGDDPDTENTVAPFATAKLLNLDTSALPLHALRDSLFEVQPDGTASFNNENTATSSVDTSAADETDDDQSPELIDTANTVVISQAYTSPDDWVVTQSVSNAWGTPAPSVADDQSDGSAAVGGSDESDAVSPAEPMRGQGTETYSITVINGTTTITSYSISESFSFGAGDAIPEEWIGAATSSVNDQPDELQAQPADDGPVVYGAPPAGSGTEAESSVTDSGAASTIVAPTAEPAAEKQQRGFTTSSNMETVVIETKIMMDDGQPGIQRVMTISFSASFSWHDGDTIDLTAPPKTTQTKTTSESSGSESSQHVTFAGDAAADPGSSSSAPTTTTPASTPDIEHTYTYNAFASGSIAGSFSVTTVYPESSGLLGLLTGQSSTSFSFGMSAMAGGSSTRKFTMKESSASGDAASETDEHLEVDILDETSSSNFTGFSFSIGNAGSSGATTADGGTMTTTGDTTDSSSTATASDPAANNAITASNLQSQDGDVIVTPTIKPKAGQQSAADMVANGVSGFQIGFDTNSSSSSTKDFQFSELTRQLNSDYWGEGHSKVTVNDFQHSESDSNISVGFGSDSTHLEISRSHSSETNILLQSDDYSLGRYMTEDDYVVMQDQVFYKEVGDSSSEFRFAFGDVQDAGLVNESDSSLSIKSEVIEHIDYAGWFNTVTRTYIFRDGLEGKTAAVPSGSTNDIDQVTMTDPPADDTSSIIRDTTTYTDNSGTTVVVHMEGVPGDDGAGPQSNALDPAQLLAEYEDRRIRAARLQQQIDEETDPSMKAYYQDLLDVENNILNDIRQSALDAGVEQSTLNDIDAAAVVTATTSPVLSSGPGLVPHQLGSLQSPDFPSPDGTGRCHDTIPDFVPPEWDSGTVQDAVKAIEDSIRKRKDDITSPHADPTQEPGHRERLRREEDWLKKLKHRGKNMATIGLGAGLMVIGTGLVKAGAAGSAVLLADDVFVTGVVDDPLIVVTGGAVLVGGGVVMLGGVIDWMGF